MKNILIFGAAGRTGRIITQLAIEYGYYVTVMVRNPGKLNMADENLEILQGDVLKYHDVENAVRGHDAVISALGSNDSGDVAVYTIGTQNIIDAMEKQSVSRFIGMSSIGAGGTKSKMHFFVKVKATVMGLHKSLNAQTAQELLLHKSNLQFSLVQVAGFNKKKLAV